MLQVHSCDTHAVVGEILRERGNQEPVTISSCVYIGSTHTGADRSRQSVLECTRVLMLDTTHKRTMYEPALAAMLITLEVVHEVYHLGEEGRNIRQNTQVQHPGFKVASQGILAALCATIPAGLRSQSPNIVPSYWSTF